MNFLPTYKKRANRPPLSKDDPDWVENEFIMQYKQNWYKGGFVKEAMPSWCDRIFYSSFRPVHSLLHLVEGSYRPAEPQTSSVLLTSDHTPIMASFVLRAARGDAPIPTSEFLNSMGSRQFPRTAKIEVFERHSNERSPFSTPHARF